MLSKVQKATHVKFVRHFLDSLLYGMFVAFPIQSLLRSTSRSPGVVWKNWLDGSWWLETRDIIRNTFVRSYYSVKRFQIMMIQLLTIEMM